ncbi:MAG: TetR/AcrR family transcriptional regulator [Anaerolineales bacterium]|nr:TetR/AcrR family transcriptional regulator [Anaerolineales bacterium]
MNKNQSIDRRIIRTRLAIRNALVTLIKEKGFDALTVSDIVVRANINRGTFYLHYKDKYDLLEQTETEILEEIQHIFLQANLLPPEDFNIATHLQRLLVILLEYVKEQADLMHALLGLQGDSSLFTRARSAIEQNLQLGAMAGLNVENLLVPQEYMLSYILQAHLGVLQVWLGNGCQESPAELARILFQLSVEGPMRAAGLVVNQS